MTNTTNYNLNLIEEHDLLDYAPFNENANIIDAALADIAEDVESIPTLESAVADNTTAISGLTSRVGALETASESQASSITALGNKNTEQDEAITGNSNAINAAENRIADLEALEGDILQYVNGNFTLNPTITKKLTYVGNPSFDQNGNINIVIPGGYLPATFSDVYVNASVYSYGSNAAYVPFVFNRVYVNAGGALVIEFIRIDDSGSVLPAPTIQTLKGRAEILFI